MSLMQVQNLYVKIKKDIILRDINFSANKGQITVIMGPSGCGKSTLLKELAGENNILSGGIHMAGYLLYDQYYHRINHRIGYVPQHDSIYEELTVYKVLLYSARVKGVKNAKAKISRLIEELHIKSNRNTKVAELSGGTRKRLSIAIELLSDPPILLLDEPTSPLDPQNVKEFHNIIKALASKGCCIIMVSHKPADVYLANQVLFLAKGGIQVYLGPPDKLTNTIIPLLKNKTSLGANATGYEKLLYIYEAMNDSTTDLTLFPQKKVVYSDSAKVPPYTTKTNFVSQTWWLTIRYAQIKISHLKNILNYIAQPILVGLLFVSFPFFSTTTLFLISLAVIWFGINNSAKEIVEDLPIYKRERRQRYSINAFLISKILVLWVISIIQIFILMLIVYYWFEALSPNGINLLAPIRTFKFLSLLSFASITLGLMLSASQKSVEKVLLLVPVILIAQIIFSGQISRPDRKLKENLSYLMISRWGMEGLSRLQDKAADKKEKTTHYKHPITSKQESVTKKVPLSIVTDILPSLPTDSMRTDTLGARESLGAYNDRLKRDKLPSWKFLNSYKRNLAIIAFFALSYYFICFIFMLSKDSIPYYTTLHPGRIKFALHVLLFIIIATILLSLFFQDRIAPNFYEEKRKNYEDLEWYKKVTGIKNK